MTSRGKWFIIVGSRNITISTQTLVCDEITEISNQLGLPQNNGTRPKHD